MSAQARIQLGDDFLFDGRPDVPEVLGVAVQSVQHVNVLAVRRFFRGVQVADIGDTPDLVHQPIGCKVNILFLVLDGVEFAETFFIDDALDIFVDDFRVFFELVDGQPMVLTVDQKVKGQGQGRGYAQNDGNNLYFKPHPKVTDFLFVHVVPPAFRHPKSCPPQPLDVRQTASIVLQRT